MLVLVFEYAVLYHIYSHICTTPRLMRCTCSRCDGLQETSRTAPGWGRAAEPPESQMSLAVVQLWNSNCVESLSGNRILSFKASFFLHGWGLLCMMPKLLCIFYCFEVIVFSLPWQLLYLVEENLYVTLLLFELFQILLLDGPLWWPRKW